MMTFSCAHGVVSCLTGRKEKAIDRSLGHWDAEEKSSRHVRSQKHPCEKVKVNISGVCVCVQIVTICERLASI